MSMITGREFMNKLDKIMTIPREAYRVDIEADLQESVKVIISCRMKPSQADEVLDLLDRGGGGFTEVVIQ